MALDIQINKPAPIPLKSEIAVYNQETELAETIKLLEAEKPVLITAYYSNGLVLLKALKTHLKKKFPNKSFQEQRAYRAEYHTLSNRVLAEIQDHKLIVKKAPEIGWFKKLYPELSNFLFPFPQIQGLNSSWQWYENGISIPVLRNKIHPYYGTYFPTRFDHLELFDKWLKRYEGAKKNAIDIGFGSGILSLQLVQHGFQKVFGTDINPNAIVGLTEFMGNTKLSRKIELEYTSLFGNFKKQTELIVFNPPWLPETQDSDGIDAAIYYNEELFPDFFEAAKKHLLPEGKVILLFSNLAHITNETKAHPIETELLKEGRFKLDRCYKKRVQTASEKTKRDQHWRDSEEVELWVLSHK
ncbi:methyltransferase [Cochleicola gelatinilyticus]|uniref:Methyltransferase type 11 n=1 Tax=Cochleicola gelatinilyticus TaxID=1763537 RepID=A0A167HI04_9FLAO|nr:methyltransferase [Cochleicola gelatinilyticus]OAB78627.1 methyltransferase type 11 [Cochleicola gelatinilyticus]